MICVLVVDDEVDLVRHVCGYLQTFPDEIEPLSANSAEGALQVLATRRPDVLLTDIRMEGMDGIELVCRARQLQPALKVLVMTAFGSPELRAQARQVGALEFIEKPVDLEDLRLVLLEAAESAGRRGQVVGGLNICEVAQYLAMAGETKVVRMRFGDEGGTLVFEAGRLAYAATRKLKGVEAFRQMARWGEGQFEEVLHADPRRYHPNLHVGLTQLVQLCASSEPEAQGSEAEPPQAEISEPTQDEPSRGEGVPRVSVEELKQAITVLRDDLGPGLVACDIFDLSGLSYAGYNEQPAASALFADTTAKLRKALGGAGFPPLGRCYLMELEDRKLVVVAVMRDLQWGMLVDGSKVNLGLLLNVALPRVITSLKDAS